MKKEASRDEVEELVQSFEKYDPLWSFLEELSKTFKMCVVNNGPKETMEFWDEYFGYSKYMKFINSDIIGIEKPAAEIYKIACDEIGVNSSEVIYMDDHCGFPEEILKLDMKFIQWVSHDKGFNEFKEYLKKIVKRCV